MRNHSACHLLQAALREVLGTHVHQSGSYVDETLCRFDISRFSAMTSDEIARVENIVNDMILAALPVTVETMSQDEAKAKGAMALFGEKYTETLYGLWIWADAPSSCAAVPMWTIPPGLAYSRS